MRKGCFVKSIVILTIFVAAVTYIVQNHFEEWIAKPGKKILVPYIENRFVNEFEFVLDSPEKDSLLSFISSYLQKMDFTDNKDSTKKEFFSRINLIVADSIVTESEIEEIKNIFGIDNEK